MMSVSGCATSGHGKAVQCSQLDPIYLSNRDALTYRTESSILYYNELLNEICE